MRQPAATARRCLLTLEELGGRGVRWPTREQAGALPSPSDAADTPRAPRPAPVVRGGALAFGSYRSIWAGPEVAGSPALAFLHPEQRVEVSALDARRLGLEDGVEMLVTDETGARLRARVAPRDAVPPGSAFLQRGIAADSANLLRGSTIEIQPLPEPVEPAAQAEPDSGPVEEALV